MATNTTTPNMSLVVPTTGVEQGPQYANDINGDLTILDAHNHSPGSGVQITPSGLNINSNLNIQDNYLTNVGAVNLEAQSGAPSLNASLYCLGVDLYYIDGSGNVIRLTQGGSIVGTAGSIGGLPSGTASVFYSGSTYVFQSATSTAANLDAASIILRDTTVSSYGITLSPPLSLGSNYSIVLPALPAQTNVVTLDTSGNLASITYDQVAYGMNYQGANFIMNTFTGITAFQADIIVSSVDAAGANALAAIITTTGANDIAQNITTPGANDIGVQMGVAGANSILNTFNGITSTQANIIGEAMTSPGSNSILNTFNTITSSQANLIVSEVNSSSVVNDFISYITSSSVANLVLGTSSNANIPGTNVEIGGKSAMTATHNIGANPLIIAGTVNADGSNNNSATGFGFNSSNPSTGMYSVTFSPAFTTLASVVATPVTSNENYIVNITSTSSSGFSVTILNAGAAILVSSAFTFIAVGK
jgi:hypothetical protein